MSNKMRKMLWMVVAIILAAMSSCSGDPGSWHTLNEQGWRYGDTLTFDGDWTCLDSVHINIYHADSYQYSNLWIEMAYATEPDSVSSDSVAVNTLVTDTFNIMLADAAGRWRGHGNGLTYNVSTAIHPSHPVAKGSPLRVRHIMRTDTLCDIEKIGLRR